MAPRRCGCTRATRVARPRCGARPRHTSALCRCLRQRRRRGLPRACWPPAARTAPWRCGMCAAAAAAAALRRGCMSPSQAGLARREAPLPQRSTRSPSRPVAPTWQPARRTTALVCGTCAAVGPARRRSTRARDTAAVPPRCTSSRTARPRACTPARAAPRRARRAWTRATKASTRSPSFLEAPPHPHPHPLRPSSPPPVGPAWGCGTARWARHASCGCPSDPQPARRTHARTSLAACRFASHARMLCAHAF
jgi:hypothetical protein